MLVSFGLYGMIEDYRMFLENLFFPSFTKLMEVA